MTVIDTIRTTVGVYAACDALQIPPATYYRRKKPSEPRRLVPSPIALSDEERTAALDVLHEDRFADLAVPQVHAQLLEEGKYICSERSMYRILESNKEVRERRDVRRNPKLPKPRLVATAPRQVWTWDITKIPGPYKRSWFHLYVILDIYSRYVVGWMLAHRESAELAKRLIETTCEREGIVPEQLIIHADRGSAMKSKTLEDLFADLGIGKSHSRPRTSDDNPYSEAQFKTLKYRPNAIEHADSILHGRRHFTDLFDWYNYEHHHSGLAMMTPATVHFGKVETVVAAKQAALDGAYRAHPERFTKGPPRAPRPAAEVWINRPNPQLAALNEELPADESIGLLGSQEPASRIFLTHHIGGPQPEFRV